MTRRLFKFFQSPPILFAFVTVFSYGLLLPFTGFYWDDWSFAWIANFLGPKEFFPVFTTIRPFLSPIFFVTTSLIPAVPIYWQIFALVIRFISGLAFWFTLKQIFPGRKRPIIITSLLFLVFPGYSQHWVAFTHINQEWIPFIFYLLSFGFTASASRQVNKYILHTVFALLFLIAGVLPTEYFVSLEPLRFLFILIIVSKKGVGFQGILAQTFKRWVPYLLIWLGNAIWLAYFYAQSYGSYKLEVIKEPLSIGQFLFAIAEVIWKAGFYIWGQVIMLASQTISAPSSLLTLGLIGSAFIFFVYYFSTFDAEQPESKALGFPALLIGIAGILLGRIPSFTAGLPLTLQSSYDRFMISMMIGGSFFIVGLMELLIKNLRARNVIFALLVALGIGQQFFNANIFRRDWERQQDIYWQLAWRIPAMKPGTILLTNEMYIDYETDHSFIGPINWMYAPDYTRADPPPYAFLFTEIRLGTSLPILQKGIEINVGIMRTLSFHSSTSQMIVIYMPKNGCLRVLDPARGDQITYDWQTPLLADAIPLSDPTNIWESDQTARLPFLSEPAHTWCYYYAKAELAYQKKNWEQVIALIEKAVSLGYTPEDPFEWLAYIEAQALTGNIETAREISNIAFEHDSNIRKGLCVVWKRVKSNASASMGMENQIDQTLLDFQCTQ